MLQLCDAGYRRVDNVLYGGECRLCDCNRHAASCDPFTGVCEVRTSSFKLFQMFGLKHQLHEIKYTSYFLSSINKIYVTVLILKFLIRFMYLVNISVRACLRLISKQGTSFSATFVQHWSQS